jgi:hypothetical protein
MRYWLSRKIFAWTPDCDGGRRSDPDRVKRPHAILAHAENVLATGSSEFALADAVVSLKRAINSRLQHIEELYRFSELFPKALGSLERLEQVGLARPLVVRQLFDIRNDIEHRDVPPPAHKRVRELVDATWYFLRTTDQACKVVPYGVVLRSAAEGSFPPEQSISLQSSREKVGRFDIAGWVKLDFLSETLQPNCFETDLIRVEPKASTPPESDDVYIQSAFRHNSTRADDERFIFGHTVLSLDLQREFWRLSIEAL